MALKETHLNARWHHLKDTDIQVHVRKFDITIESMMIGKFDF